MKIILAGTTGFVGREVLARCLNDSSITSIVVLSRRELPADYPGGAKLKVAILEDFTSYSKDVLGDIEGASACIWTLGLTPGNASSMGNEKTRKISVDYTVSAMKCLLTQAGSDQKGRFVYCSGALAERDQTKSLWFSSDFRKVRGEAENAVVEFAKEHSDHFEGYVVRPGMILAEEMNARDLVRGLLPSVKVGVLAKRLMDLALKGSSTQVIDNADI